VQCFDKPEQKIHPGSRVQNDDGERSFEIRLVAASRDPNGSKHDGQEMRQKRVAEFARFGRFLPPVSRLRMLWSRLFVRTRREGPKDVVAASHKLLVRAGFVQQSAAGMYRFLPLGFRVLRKAEELVAKKLDANLAQRVNLPLLSRANTWRESGRWDEYGPELMRLEDRRGEEFCLGPTFEEEVTSLVGNFGVLSEKEMPIFLYQIAPKYRDEMRPRYGLIRAREFVMMDLYTFDVDENAAMRTYQRFCKVYEEIFSALNLPFVKVVADSGAMGGNYTHEFQVIADVGEDDVIQCDTGDFIGNVEVVESDLKRGVCQESKCSCGGKGSLIRKRGIEVGQSFVLGQKYSEVFGASFRDTSSGQTRFMHMGCYGIGITRLLSAIIESEGGNDESGIIWPHEIAPFKAIIITGAGNKDVRTRFELKAQELYKHLKLDEEILLDDRWEHSFGKKITDAKLIGIPNIFIVGKENADTSDTIEWIERKTLQSRNISFAEAKEIIRSTS